MERETLQAAFIAGANWQKRQMMKGANEYPIQVDVMSEFYVKIPLDWNHKVGDKVKLIILKENQ